MHTLRTRFKRDIIAEFLPPQGRAKRRADKVIIFCGGMPGVPAKRPLLEFFSKKGYWVFLPRYRGSWESGGKFLRISPEKDILDIISELPRGFKSLWDGKKYRVRPSKLFLFGSSFGGPAALLASRDPRVTKIVALSPVVDWCAPSKEEPLDKLFRFVQSAFGEGYRVSKKDWNKLKSGTFYNPMAHFKEIDGKKLFIIHAKDDEIVGWRPVQKFAELTGSRLILLKKGGHSASSLLTKPKFYKAIAKFLRSK
ncbi:MAG: prolyl oligopeptidase family serine peptidase [Candidatus Liptonbacteria bacterium]|nr:prolyl oligopeptidase family serine peptidase [Candidatus Liptonbacteria bacterium]